MYLPGSQRRCVMDTGAYERTDAVRADRIYPKELRERRGQLVITCRGGMLRELEAAGCLGGASAVWSQWPGYLDRPSGMRTVAELRRFGIRLEVHHASGHATEQDLVQLAENVGAGQVVPYHTDAPGSGNLDF